MLRLRFLENTLVESPDDGQPPFVNPNEILSAPTRCLIDEPAIALGPGPRERYVLP